MAFVSVKHIRAHQREPKEPIFYVSSDGLCRVTQTISGGAARVEVQIDFQAKTVRLRVGDGLSNKLCGKYHNRFSVPKAAAELMIPVGADRAEILMTLHDDGWWYGSYGDEVAE